MNWNKNILQFLLSCFIIANLTTKFGFTPILEVNPVKQDIELVTSKRALTYQVVNFDEAQKQLYLTNTPQISSEVGWFNRIRNINQKTDQQLKTQNQTTLELKPILLKIVLNDSIQSTTYCI